MASWDKWARATVREGKSQAKTRMKVARRHMDEWTDGKASDTIEKSSAAARRLMGHADEAAADGLKKVAETERGGRFFAEANRKLEKIATLPAITAIADGVRSRHGIETLAGWWLRSRTAQCVPCG